MVNEKIKKGVAKSYADAIKYTVDDIYETININHFSTKRAYFSQLNSLDELIKDFKEFLIENDMVEDD